jgi:hypothetical protein
MRGWLARRSWLLRNAKDAEVALRDAEKPLRSFALPPLPLRLTNPLNISQDLLVALRVTLRV